MTADDLAFEPPGPGSWMLDTTHHGRKPVTRYLQAIYTEGVERGMPQFLARYGLPLARFEIAYVHGCLYLRPVAVGEPERPKSASPPPKPVMWALARLHPGLRRRNRDAATAWREKRWRQDVDRWFDHDRADVVRRNLALQEVAVADLDALGLAEHIGRCDAHLVAEYVAAFASHGGDLVPVGDYLAHCVDWGIDPGEASSLLTGASPASLETVAQLEPVARALAATATPPRSVDEIRAIGPDVAAAVDGWLREHGHRVVTSDDLDASTLVERPDLQLVALRASAHVHEHQPAPDPERLRDRVPVPERPVFDEVLGEARYGLRLRDDNVGVRGQWPLGLLRRGLLEASARLVAQGRLKERHHIFDLDRGEVRALLTGGASPTDTEVAERHADRAAVTASLPPTSLGPDAGAPPAEVFPPPLRRATRAVLAMIAAMNGASTTDRLRGVGVGTTPYTGRALVARDAEDVLDRLEDGDVVVTACTGPTWNSLLPAIGALVVEEGGPMSHAAIVAREFGIPAVVGATGATAAVPDGAQVTVDPSTGTITIE